MEIKPIKVLRTRKKISVKPGEYLHQLRLDPKGFFLIKIQQKSKKIHVGWCNYKYQVTHEFTSKSPMDLYKAIIKSSLTKNPSHLAYLGYQLRKAFDCIKHNQKYVQD